MNSLEVTGNARERGIQIGCAFADQIRKKLYQLPADPERRQRQLRARNCMVTYLNTCFPEILEECEGIAEGADIEPAQVVLKGLRPALGPAARYMGCTSIAFAESDVGPIIGKTDDGQAQEDEAETIQDRMADLAILTIRPDAGHDVLCVTPVGEPKAECGINSGGLCVGTSSGHPDKTHSDARGIPLHMISRLVLLNCASVPEALAFMRSHDVSGKGINIVLVDSKGNTVATENTYTMHGVREADEDVVFSTNHYVAPEMQQFTVETDPGYINTRYFQNSLNRMANLIGRFSDGRKKLTFGEMKSVLADHHRPGGICQHADRNDSRMTTRFAAILVSRSREMWLTEGQPCGSEFVRHALH
jgi:predicted choloylglycine hydrolase